ncbi:hypothetical protein LTR81_027632 [Elasticomyces elasticus]
MDQHIDSVYSDFYDSLFVHSLLQHEATSKPAFPIRKPAQPAFSTHSGWHRFLDDLCFMCDSRTGGKTVVAVLAERRSEETIFWLATPTMMQQSTANHLDGLLRVIRKMLRTDETHVQPLIDDVIRRSIERSPQRIHHYGGRLTHLIESMVQGDGTGMGEPLATDLRKLVMLRDVWDLSHGLSLSTNADWLWTIDSNASRCEFFPTTGRPPFAMNLSHG